MARSVALLVAFVLLATNLLGTSYAADDIQTRQIGTSKCTQEETDMFLSRFPPGDCRDNFDLLFSDGSLTDDEVATLCDYESDVS